MQRKITLLCLTALVASPFSFANLTELEGLFGSELEENAAAANQAAYERMREAGCDDEQRAPSETCGGSLYRTWESVREIVHTANDLLGNGPTLYSLGLDLEGLGFTLRWTAGEEFSTQGDLSNNFVRGQMAGLATRMSALRSGGARVAINGRGYEKIAGLSGPKLGGGAGDESSQWSRWGFFLNVDSRSGDRAPTAREDAFDFDGYSVNTGVDYRITDNWVAGVMLGYQDESLEFDPSQSIVEGDVDMSGLSLQPYLLYNADRWYLSAALGMQSMDFSTRRTISYPSLNPQIESTDTEAISDTSASAFSISSSAGYTLFQDSAFGLEPFIALDYRDISVDGYTETDIKNEGFAFIVEEQSFSSLESTLGVKLNYVLTPKFGVVIPFIDIEYRTQHDTDPRVINAVYVDAADALADTPEAVFALPTDEADSNYLVYTLGFSAVIRGARQLTADGAAGGGIQVFLHYRQYENLDYYNQSEIAGGLRYEF